MKKVLLIFAIALTAVFLALSQTNGSDAKKSQLDGTWELVSGQPLPEGARIEDARARFENGVLEITVPVEEARNKRREIPIERASAAPAWSFADRRSELVVVDVPLLHAVSR